MTTKQKISFYIMYHSMTTDKIDQTHWYEISKRAELVKLLSTIMYHIDGLYRSLEPKALPFIPMPPALFAPLEDKMYKDFQYFKEFHIILNN